MLLWQRYQDWLYYEGLEFYLDVSRMRFDDAFVEALQPKFEAFQDMAALEGGAIANPMKTAWLVTTGCVTPHLNPRTDTRYCSDSRAD